MSSSGPLARGRARRWRAARRRRRRPRRSGRPGRRRGRRGRRPRRRRRRARSRASGGGACALGRAGALVLQPLAQRERRADLGGGALDERDRAALLVERGGEVRVVLRHRLELGLARGRQRAVGGGGEIRHEAVVVGFGQAHHDGSLHREDAACSVRIPAAQDRRRAIGSGDERAHEVPPARGRDPHALGEPAAGPARRAAAAAEPRDGRAGRPRRPHADLPDGADHAGGLARAGRSRSPSRCARPTSSGGRRRCTARGAWSRRSAPRRGSSTSTRASPPRARTSRTRPSRRPTRTRRPASSKLATETGAGQWGSSLAFACSLFGLECEVFMVGSSYDQKPYRRSMMETWGATRAPLALRPHRGGPLAGRAHRRARSGSRSPRPSRSPRRTRTATTRSGSVLNHVLLHQTVIGQEAIAQLELAGAGMPDVIVGCVGGGSNFGGLVFPFLRHGATPRIIAAEPAACPTLTPRRVRLRLRRHRRDDAADADVHARPRLRAAARARRRAALPRRRADGLRARAGGDGGAARLQAERDLRGGGAVRPRRRGSSPRRSRRTRSGR